MLSIVTPVLNGVNYIEENIKSIYNLSIPFEHIIVDGGSTDGTIEIIMKYHHIKLIHQSKSKGMYGAINEGFQIASGDYFSYINCDDKILKEGFEKMYLETKKQDYSIVYSDAILFYSESKKVLFKGRHFPKYFLKNGFMPFVQPSSIFSKRIYFEFHGFNGEDFKIIGDLDFFQRIANKLESSFKYIPIISSIFYVHENSLGNSNSHLHPIECNNLINTPNFNLYNRILFKLF